MYYNVIQWKAKLRLWQASEKRKALGRESFRIKRQIQNLGALTDPNIRAYRTREEERKLARLQSELPAAMAAEIDCGRRFRLVMGLDP